MTLQMYYKQKKQREYPHTKPNDQNQKYEGSERTLLKLWTQLQVEESYQNIVIAYLDQLEDKKIIRTEILEQIKLTYAKTTSFFRIRTLLMERDTTIQCLYGWVTNLQKYKNVEQKGEPDLSNVCDFIDQLRKIHMLVSQEVTQMFTKYRCTFKVNRNFPGTYYLDLFKTFDKDIEFLKTSILKFYMPFSQGFDPLFLEQARQIRKLYIQKRIVYDQNIEQLFNVNASYLYRLLRAHKKMLQYISLRQDIDTLDRQPISYGNTQKYVNLQEQQQNEDYRPKRRQHGLDLSLDDPIEIPIRKQFRQKKQRVIQTPQKQYPNLKQQKYKSRRQQVSKYQNKRLSSSRSKEDNKSNIQINQDDSYNSHKIKKSQISSKSKSKKQQIQRNIEDSDIEKDKQQIHNIQAQPNPKSNQYKSRRIITELPKGLKKQRIQKKKNQLSTPVIKKKTPRTIKVGRSITPKNISPADETQLKHNRHSINIHSPKIRLPKIIQPLKTSKNQDCFCRQKYKSKKHLHSPEQGEEEAEEDIEAKRKHIIRNINEKYRKMAEKERLYELSKMGDLTYHKMKSRLRSNTNSRIIKKTSRKNEQNHQKETDII